MKKADPKVGFFFVLQAARCAALVRTVAWRTGNSEIER